MQLAKQEEQDNLNLMSDHDVWQSIFESYSATADADLDEKLTQPFSVDINSSELYTNSDQLWAASDLNLIEEDEDRDAKQLLNNEFELDLELELELVPMLALCDPLEEMQGCTPQDYHSIKAWDSQISSPNDEAQPSTYAVEGSVSNCNLWPDQCEWGSEYYSDKSSATTQEFLPNSNSVLLQKVSAKQSISTEEQQQEACNNYESSPRKALTASCQQRSDITYAELSHYFHMPITQAARELKVGLTVLKKRCREFGIPRWPHRKMKSLGNLINNIQELAKSNGGVSQSRLTNAVEILKEQKRLMEEIPGIELDERTKRLRQACFKANYKKRRAAQNNTSTSSSTSSSSSSSSSSSCTSKQSTSLSSSSS